MGKSQRDKGARFEREIVKKLNEAGISAKRVPLSGATWMKGDLLIGKDGDEEVAELKKRGNGFKQLYVWLDDHRYLIVAADRKEPLIVQRLEDWVAGEVKLSLQQD